MALKFESNNLFTCILNGHGQVKVNVGLGCVLKLKRVTLDTHDDTATGKLYILTNKQDEVLLASLSSHNHNNNSSTNLTLDLGPQTFSFISKATPGTSIHIIGHVETSSSSSKEDSFVSIFSSDNNSNVLKTKSTSSKRKSEDTATADDEDDTNNNLNNSKQQAKKLRKKIILQKEKELQEALNTNNKNHHQADEDKPTTNTATTKTLTPVKILKERKMPGGITVKDIIIGAGSQVKMGRKVAILYEGRLLDTKQVFDRKMNRNNPLVFRQGVREVIPGLEKGIEQMRVGGERIITIPPNLGYGKKGSGPTIPPNSILEFTVTLIQA